MRSKWHRVQFEQTDGMRIFKTKGHATTEQVTNGEVRHWERKGNHLADFYAKLSMQEHGLTQADVDGVGGFRFFASQISRFGAEQDVLIAKVLGASSLQQEVFTNPMEDCNAGAPE